jgi:hypothetical protein
VTLCARPDQKREHLAAAKLFKKYSGMLPLIKRVATIGKRRRCYEDETTILFEIGRERYVFDKINAREFGYLDKPILVKK